MMIGIKVARLNFEKGLSKIYSSAVNLTVSLKPA